MIQNFCGEPINYAIRTGKKGNNGLTSIVSDSMKSAMLLIHCFLPFYNITIFRKDFGAEATERDKFSPAWEFSPKLME